LCGVGGGGGGGSNSELPQAGFPESGEVVGKTCRNEEKVDRGTLDLEFSLDSYFLGAHRGPIEQEEEPCAGWASVGLAKSKVTNVMKQGSIFHKQNEIPLNPQ
jgi:hypothetical protein